MQGLVSIGLPVYNGEASIARAIESLRAQDYPHLEIVISDNASTDGTQEICLSYAATDARIRYIRQPENIGAIGNFSALIEQATGEYFMWAAHDDVRRPEFIRECIAKLQAEPDAVLCQACTDVVMDSTGELLCTNRLDSLAGVANVQRRYWEVLRRFPMTGIYGVFRTAAVKKTCGLTRTIASDVSFVRELALYGHFTQVERRLFTYRIRDQWNDLHEDYRVFTGKSSKPFWYVPFLVLFASDARKIMRSEQSATGKGLLLALLAAALVVEKAQRLLVRTVLALAPRALGKRMVPRIYWALFHNRNVEVVSHSRYRDRIINPIVMH